jgi:hypothetical protein
MHFICTFETGGAAGNGAHIGLNSLVNAPSNCVHLRKVGHYWIVFREDRTVNVASELIQVTRLISYQPVTPGDSITITKPINITHVEFEGKQLANNVRGC